MATGTNNIYVDSYVLILACSFVLAGSLQIRYLLSYAVSTKTGPFFPERMSSYFVSASFKYSSLIPRIAICYCTRVCT